LRFSDNDNSIKLMEYSKGSVASVPLSGTYCDISDRRKTQAEKEELREDGQMG